MRKIKNFIKGVFKHDCEKHRHWISMHVINNLYEDDNNFKLPFEVVSRKVQCMKCKKVWYERD